MILGVSLILSVAVSSCADRSYDFMEKELDLTVSIGGDSLAFPVGGVDTVRLGSLFNLEDTEGVIVVDAEGNYSLHVADTKQLELPQIDDSSLRMDDIVIGSAVSVPFDIPGTPILPGEGTIHVDQVILPMEDEVEVEITMSDIPSEIVSVDAIHFDEAYIRVDFRLEDEMYFGNDFKARLNASLIVPEEIVMEGATEGNVIKVDDYFENGVLEVMLPVKSFNYGGTEIDGSLEIRKNIVMEGELELTDADMDSDYFSGNDISISYHVTVGNIVPSTMEGVFDYEVSENSEFEIGNIPDFLKSADVNLDFAYPRMLLVSRSNVGIPFDANVSMVPYVGNQANNNGKIDLALSIDASSDADEVKESKFVIAEDRSYVEDYAGYEFVQSDLSSFLSVIPDNVKFNLSARTQKDESHYFDFNADYKVDVDYELEVPFAFGENFKAAVKDTLSLGNSSSETIAKLMEKGLTVSISGEVTNTIPLHLEIVLGALDKNGRRLPVNSLPCLVPAGISSENPYKGELVLEMNSEAGADYTDIAYLELNVNVASGQDIKGITLNEKDYMVIDRLCLALEGGIVLDLGEIGGSEN